MDHLGLMICGVALSIYLPREGMQSEAQRPMKFENLLVSVLDFQYAVEFNYTCERASTKKKKKRATK